MHITILPGWQQNCTHWQEVNSILRLQAVSVNCIDIFSSDEKNPFGSCIDIPSVAEIVIQELKKNERTILVGHSFGGRVAAYIAVHNPELLLGIVLVDSPNLYRPDFKTLLRTYFSRYLRPIRMLFPESVRIQFRSDDYNNVKGTNFEKLFNSMVGDDQENLLKRIHLPTLVVWGENDTVVPVSVGQEIAKMILNAKLMTFKNVGHNIQIEKASLLAHTLITYAQSI